MCENLGRMHGGTDERPNPLFLIALAALCTFVVVRTMFDVRRIDGDSMEPTLRRNQTIIVWKLAYGLRGRLFGDGYLLVWKEVKRNDIIVFEHPVTGEAVVKRCLGVAGDLTARDEKGFRLVDDEPAPKDAREIPPGYLFVAGDRSSTSIDSRHYGLVRVSSVYGRVLLFAVSALPADRPPPADRRVSTHVVVE